MTTDDRPTIACLSLSDLLFFEPGLFSFTQLQWRRTLVLHLFIQPVDERSQPSTINFQPSTFYASGFSFTTFLSVFFTFAR